MTNLTRLFYVGQPVAYLCDGEWYHGTVKETHSDHVIVDCPAISDHIWFANGVNLDCLYPEYNLVMPQMQNCKFHTD